MPTVLTEGVPITGAVLLIVGAFPDGNGGAQVRNDTAASTFRTRYAVGFWLFVVSTCTGVPETRYVGPNGVKALSCTVYTTFGSSGRYSGRPQIIP